MVQESNLSFNYNRALQGHYYAVGVGPGAPDLLTVRASKIIETADVLVCPRSSIAETSLALDTIKHLTNENQVIINHQYAMIRDEESTLDRWEPVANEIINYCKSKMSVVQITIGDPLIYSTIAYVLPFISEAMGSDYIHIIPGISAFQITASKFIDPLIIQEDRLCVMPATDLDAVKKAIPNCETLVLYKCAKKLESLAVILKEHGLEDQCKVVCYAEQGAREVVYDSIDSAASSGNGYMATAIIYIGRKKWDQD